MHAQVAPTPPALPPTQEKVEKLSEFVVTGSFIPITETAFTAGITPVLRLDEHVIEQSGFSTTAELLQRVTVVNGGGVPVANNAASATRAAASVSLRGLGSDATLVLVDGRRVASYPVAHGGTTAFVDLNSIPLSAVDTVEILRDGASAIYGADAIAGVVNIKLKRTPDRPQLKIKYGNTTHADAGELTVSFTSGAQTERTSAVFGFNYYRRNAILARDRDFSAAPPFLSTNGSPANLQLTAIAANAALSRPASEPLPGPADPTSAILFAQSGAGAANRGATPAADYVYSAERSSHFNVNEFSTAWPRRENGGVFAYAERKVGGADTLRAYAELNFQHIDTVAQLAPQATGDFATAGGSGLVIPARTANPLLTVIDNATRALRTVDAGTAAPAGASPGPGTRFVNGTVQRLAAPGATNPFNPFNQDIGGESRARLMDFGERLARNRTDALLVSTGLRAEGLGGRWNFEAGGSFSAVRDTARDLRVAVGRLNRLLNGADPFFQPGNAEYLGAAQPYNPFGYYQNPSSANAAIARAARVETRDVNNSTLQQLSAVVSTGTLFDLPAGSVGFASGMEYRHEALGQHPDPAAAGGDLIGRSPNAVTHGARDTWGAFVEASAPLLRRAPAARELSATMAIRHESFLREASGATVPKLGLRWQPLDDTLTVRAGWSEGFRAPSLYELHSTRAALLTPIVNPVTGANEPEQFVTIAGNRSLRAEQTSFVNAGLLWSPQSPPLKGVTIAVDYWQARRRRTVASNFQDTVDRFFAAWQHPDAAGVAGAGADGLFAGESVALNGDGSIAAVNSVFLNSGATDAAGIDYSVNGVWRAESFGRFAASATWSQYTHYRRRTAAEGGLLERVSQSAPEGTRADDGYLRWRGRVQLEWERGEFSSVFGASYTDGFWDLEALGTPLAVSAQWLCDAQVSYRFLPRRGRILGNTTLAIGARNLFDRAPPFAAGFGNNPVGYPGALYTGEGRFVYVSLLRRF